MQIAEAIVHYIKKDRNAVSEVKLRNECLPKGEKLTELVDTLRHLYNDKSGHGTGIFFQDQKEYPLSKYLLNNHNENWNFISFSTKAMELFKLRLDQAAMATGSYVIFVRYLEQEIRYMVIAILKQKPGLGFDEEMNLSDTRHIDLEHLHEMSRINLTSWRDGSSKYISFAKKRSVEDFSKYFRMFIGCDEFSESKELTKALVAAVISYCNDNSFDEERKSRLRTTAFHYCEEKYSAGEPVSLKSLSHRFDEDNPDAFITYINDREGTLHLADGFEPDKNVYKRFQKLVLRDNGLTFSFDTELLHTRIIFNKSEHTLLIRNVPSKFLDQLSEY